MQTLVQVGVSNAAVAAALALVAFVVGRWAKRPALSHGLWLLVLLKLITPPLWQVPIDWPRAKLVRAPVESPIEPAKPVATIETELPSIDLSALDLPMVEPVPSTHPSPETVTDTTAPATSLEATATVIWPSWPVIVGVLWLGGTAFYFAVAGLRLRRFRRLLRHACPANPELREQVGQMAAKLRVGSVPEVWMVPGPVSPMLWAFIGRPRILLPTELWNKLNYKQQATLLAHELAHLRRRDHWTRRLELVVTALYWWHPVVWLARREISVAEEQCCDAWVVWLLPETARDYALALMETVDFLSETRPALPPAASGVGHVHQLRRRLAMIMRGSTPRALSGAGLVAVLTLALLTLPFVPTLAQSEPIDEPADVLVTVPIDDELPIKEPLPFKVVTYRDETRPLQEIEDAKDGIRLMQAQIEVKKVEMDESKIRMKQAKERAQRIEKLAASGTVSSEEVAKARDEVEIAGVQLHQKEAQIREAQIKMEVAVRRIERLGAPKEDVLKRVPLKPPAEKSPSDRSREAGLQAEKQLLEKVTAELNDKRKLVEAERMRAEQAQMEAVKMREMILAERARADAVAKQATDFEKAYMKQREDKSQSDLARLKAVEQKLDALAKEMDALRKDLKSLLDQRK